MRAMCMFTTNIGLNCCQQIVQQLGGVLVTFYSKSGFIVAHNRIVTLNDGKIILSTCTVSLVISLAGQESLSEQLLSLMLTLLSILDHPFY